MMIVWWVCLVNEVGVEAVQVVMALKALEDSGRSGSPFPTKYHWQGLSLAP